MIVSVVCLCIISLKYIWTIDYLDYYKTILYDYLLTDNFNTDIFFHTSYSVYFGILIAIVLNYKILILSEIKIIINAILSHIDRIELAYTKMASFIINGSKLLGLLDSKFSDSLDHFVRLHIYLANRLRNIDTNLLDKSIVTIANIPYRMSGLFLRLENKDFHKELYTMIIFPY